MATPNFVQVQPNSTGLKLDTSELVVGANTVERQNIVIADPTTATNLATVSAGGALSVRSINDATNASAVVGTALAVVKASAGRLVSVLVTSVGTVAVPIYDNASAASGTIIGYIPASPTLGVFIVFAAPAANGITVGGAAGGSTFTVMYA